MSTTEEKRVDYAELYHEMVRATEKAIDILIEAQRRCEELYIAACEKNTTEKSSAEAGD